MNANRDKIENEWLTLAQRSEYPTIAFAWLQLLRFLSMRYDKCVMDDEREQPSDPLHNYP